jgi:hypothetical protein
VTTVALVSVFAGEDEGDACLSKRRLVTICVPRIPFKVLINLGVRRSKHAL